MPFSWHRQMLVPTDWWSKRKFLRQTVPTWLSHPLPKLWYIWWSPFIWLGKVFDLTLWLISGLAVKELFSNRMEHLGFLWQPGGMLLFCKGYNWANVLYTDSFLMWGKFLFIHTYSLLDTWSCFTFNIWAEFLVSDLGTIYVNEKDSLLCRRKPRAAR